MVRAAFLGLGVMGYPMAGHLARAGHRVTVYNRTAEKAERWLAEHGAGGGATASTPVEAVAGAEFVFICVGNDDDVRSVTRGPAGALAGMTAGSTLVDHTTASAHLARDLYETALQSDVGFIDAPVSGGEAGARNGALTVMCGGDQYVFDRAKPIMDAYGRAVTLMGASGSGQQTKMVNQLLIAGLVQGLAEGLAFGIKAGLDMDKVIDVIAKGAAQSWQLENRAKTMVAGQFDFGFAVQWMRKDLSICFEEAARLGAALPVANLVDGFYAEIVQRGGRRWDTSSLITRLVPPRADGGEDGEEGTIASSP